jgi:hypothetical protein
VADCYDRRETGTRGGAPHHVREVLKGLMDWARKYGDCDPPIAILMDLARKCRQCVVNAIGWLAEFDFLTKHRRIKQIEGPFGRKMVQASNAYEIRLPKRAVMRSIASRRACS